MSGERNGFGLTFSIALRTQKHFFSVSASFDIGESNFWLPSSKWSLFISKEFLGASDVSLN